MSDFEVTDHASRTVMFDEVAKGRQQFTLSDLRAVVDSMRDAPDSAPVTVWVPPVPFVLGVAHKWTVPLGFHADLRRGRDDQAGPEVRRA